MYLFISVGFICGIKSCPVSMSISHLLLDGRDDDNDDYGSYGS